jgi:hypothetical protein
MLKIVVGNVVETNQYLYQIEDLQSRSEGLRGYL